jgi:hypothetical protein
MNDYSRELAHVIRNMEPGERFTGEVCCSPFREMKNPGEEHGFTEHCSREEAEFWGIYVGTKEKGNACTIFDWVADFDAEEDGKVFAEELSAYIKANFELAAGKEF